MEFTAKYLADYVEGTIDGNPNVIISEISKIEEGKPNSITFLANLQYEKYIYSTKASVVVVDKGFKPESNINSTLIRVNDAYVAFAKMLELYEEQTQNNICGIEQGAFVSDTAKLGTNNYIGFSAYIGNNTTIGDNVKIYPGVYVGNNVIIGNDSVLYPGVKVYRNCQIGKKCIIHAGVIIGSDGFGFAHCTNDLYQKVPQTGNVIIESDVEIGANCTIDRATIGSTIIRRGVKLDNLIQIAHNVEIGENTVIAAQTGISGSTKIGRNCMIGGQVGIVGHITIADNVKVAAQSGVATSITKKGEIVQGSPAYPVVSYQKSYVLYKKLPDLNYKIEQLQKELEDLKANYRR
jgi:UDP-3-O-[3-hydroxymyristoyl] glucosamine N-acyltransferase